MVLVLQGQGKKHLWLVILETSSLEARYFKWNLKWMKKRALVRHYKGRCAGLKLQYISISNFFNRIIMKHAKGKAPKDGLIAT